MSETQSGIVSATIDGNDVDVAGDAKYSAAVIKQDILSGQSGAFQGIKRMPKNGFIAFKARMGGPFSARDYSGMNGVTVILVLADGTTVQGANLVQTEEVEVDTMEGTVDLKFEGLVEEA